MSVQDQLSDIEKKMLQASQQAPKKKGTTPPVLIAVSKNQSEELIDEALSCGLHDFGENRVQEAYAHWQTRKQQYQNLTLHLIGPLQSNKAADAVALFDVIHSVDRDKIARLLAKEMKKQSKNIPCFIQVNIGREPQKSGIGPDELSAFYTRCVNDYGLHIMGLMCIPPAGCDSKPYFNSLRKYADDLGLDALSMGMSGDFETAIACGATHIRVGTILFGKR